MPPYATRKVPSRRQIKYGIVFVIRDVRMKKKKPKHT
jgi:hypothetical protein